MTKKTRGDIGGVLSWRAILRVVTGWFAMPLLIVLQSSRGQNANSARGHYALACALLGQSRLKEAENDARRAIVLNSAFAFPYLELAEIHFRERNYLPLLEELDSYLKLEPNGAACRSVKETRKAIRDALMKSAEAKPEPPQ